MTIVVIVMVTVYFLLNGVRGLLHSPRVYQRANGQRHFAVLIPARNEEKVIGHLIHSLKCQRYPPGLMDIYVVLNNSSDRTGAIAHSCGVHVLEYGRDVSSKGSALEKAFQELSSHSDIDAFLVFDADNVVDPLFAEVMNDAMDEGYAIVQGRRTGKNTGKNVITGIYELFYMMQNYLFNNARSSMRRSASINGTGWCVSADWIARNGYQAKTLTEDIEFTVTAAMSGECIGYAHGAKTYDEYPDSIRRVFRQLPRWIFGQIQCMRSYASSLLRNGIKSRACLDMGLVMIVPAVIFLVTLLVVFSVCWPGYSYLTGWVSRWILPLLLLFYVELIALELIERKISSDTVRVTAGSILAFPFFLLAWIPIINVSLFRTRCEWKHMEHDVAVTIEEME